MTEQIQTKNTTKSIFYRMDYFLFHFSLIIFMQSMLVSGFFNSINTTIEKRYQMTTKEIGYIYMIYELACLPTTIILSLIAYKLNRARVIGFGGILISVGVILFCLPHFIGSEYNLAICNNNNTMILCNKLRTGGKNCASTTDTWALAFFCISKIFIGIGSSPIYILGPSYIWDNISTKQYSIYSSVFYTFGGLGPPIGFILGGVFLGIYIDIPKEPKCKNMNPSHPLWLGAWWIGLLMIAVIILVCTLPMIKFPKFMSSEKILSIANDSNIVAPVSSREKSMSDGTAGDGSSLKKNANNNQNSETTFKATSTIIPKSFYELRDLLSNTIWLLMTMTTVMEQSVMQACTTYFSKYLQIMFNVPANQASYLLGGIIVPAAISGVLTGGLIMHKFQPSQITTIKGLAFMITITGFMTFTVMFLGCEDFYVVGVTTDYNNISKNKKYTLDSDCNYMCHCSPKNYEPVCNKKEFKNYYSSCYAGCLSLSVEPTSKRTYTNCSCSTADKLSVGKCDPYCPSYYIVLVIVFLQIFLTAVGQIPVNIVTLNSVPVSQSSLAMGFQVFAVRLLAFIPVPMYYGALFDYACLVNVKDECTTGNICYEYNTVILPYIYLGTSVSIKLINFILIVSTYICIKEKGNSNFIRKDGTRLIHVTSDLTNSNSNNIKPIQMFKDNGSLLPYGSENKKYFCFNTVAAFYSCCNQVINITNLNK